MLDCYYGDGDCPTDFEEAYQNEYEDGHDLDHSQIGNQFLIRCIPPLLGIAAGVYLSGIVGAAIDFFQQDDEDTVQDTDYADSIQTLFGDRERPDEQGVTDLAVINESSTIMQSASQAFVAVLDRINLAFSQVDLDISDVAEIVHGRIGNLLENFPKPATERGVTDIAVLQEPFTVMESVSEAFNTVMERMALGFTHFNENISNVAGIVHEKITSFFDSFDESITNCIIWCFSEEFIAEQKELHYGRYLLCKEYPNIDIDTFWQRSLTKNWPNGYFEIYCDGFKRLFDLDEHSETVAATEMQSNHTMAADYDDSSVKSTEPTFSVKEMVKFFERIGFITTVPRDRAQALAAMTAQKRIWKVIPEVVEESTEEDDFEVTTPLVTVNRDDSSNDSDGMEKDGFYIISSRYTNLE